MWQQNIEPKVEEVSFPETASFVANSSKEPPKPAGRGVAGLGERHELLSSLLTHHFWCHPVDTRGMTEVSLPSPVFVPFVIAYSLHSTLWETPTSVFLALGSKGWKPSLLHPLPVSMNNATLPPFTSAPAYTLLMGSLGPSLWTLGSSSGSCFLPLCSCLCWSFHLKGLRQTTDTSDSILQAQTSPLIERMIRTFYFLIWRIDTTLERISSKI